MRNKLLAAWIFWLAVVVVSCGRGRLERQLAEFVGTEIVIPDGLRQMIAGRDTVAIDPASQTVRMVIWVDSTACSSCQLGQMFRYSGVTNFHHETGSAFIPIFVFSPPRAKLDETMTLLKYSEFEYPIFIDERGLFPAANRHIPADGRLHTFLLDRAGVVSLVGDPVARPDLWDLYKSTFIRLSAAD